MNRTEAIRFLADYFAARENEEFTTPHNIESLRLMEFNTKPITGSVFEEINSVLRALGHRPAHTFGELTEMLGLTQYDAHRIGCSCNGAVVVGEEIAQRLRSLIT